MKKVFIHFADGFEEIEAITPVDVLRRAGCEVVTVSV
ncbi:MAG: DJ-1/PfpI family protein, partial [Bacteroidales bacterium]|nr:DJ-1/PfpI family protein [Bacteroidales bacterium]